MGQMGWTPVHQRRRQVAEALVPEVQELLVRDPAGITPARDIHEALNQHRAEAEQPQELRQVIGAAVSRAFPDLYAAPRWIPSERRRRWCWIGIRLAQPLEHEDELLPEPVPEPLRHVPVAAILWARQHLVFSHAGVLPQREIWAVCNAHLASEHQPPISLVLFSRMLSVLFPTTYVAQRTAPFYRGITLVGRWRQFCRVGLAWVPQPTRSAPEADMSPLHVSALAVAMDKEYVDE